MTDPRHPVTGEGLPPYIQQYMSLTSPPPRRVRPATLILAGAAAVAMLGAGIVVGSALTGSPDSGDSVETAVQAPAVSPPVTSASSRGPATSASAPPPAPLATTPVAAAPAAPSKIVAWDPATSEPSKLRGPVMLNTEEDVAAVPGGKFFQDVEMVKVPAGKWRLAARSKKAVCYIRFIDLPYRDLQDVAVYRSGASQVVSFAADDMGIVLGEDCVATLELAFED